MKIFALASILLAGLAAPAFSCNLTAGPGTVVRYAEGQTGGLASVGCIFRDKWEVRAYWIGVQRIYHDEVQIESYPALSVSRLWMFREGKRIRPFLGTGLLFKESQRCHFDGDEDCNRQLPLPVSFLAFAGVKLGDVVVTWGHASNDGLDHGPEKKNLGLDFVHAAVWF